MSEAAREPVECIVTIDDTRILDFYPYLEEVRVEMTRTAATAGTLILETIRDEQGGWLVQDAGSDEPLFLPWRPCRIEAAFGSRIEEVMRGYIKEVKVDYPEDMSSAQVTISLQDESLLLDREHIRRTWSTADNAMSDGDIVRTIASDHQLAAQAQDGQANVSLVNNGTYVRFLQDRAKANGYEFYVREGTIFFHPPELEGKAQATIMVYAGLATNCLGFSARYDGHKPDQVVIARAAATGAAAEEETFTPDLPLLGRTAATSENRGLTPFAWQLERPSGATAAEADARAQAAANENAWKVIAEGELDGALYGHVLQTFKTVAVDGVGDTYGGLYYVDKVQHRFSMDGYRQRFTLIRNAVGEQARGGSDDRIAGAR